MTLVVARRSRKHAWIVADTKISDPKGNVRSREFQLKLFSLPGGVMAAYSGSPDVVHDALQKICQKHSDVPMHEIAEHAHRLIQGTNVEFILAHEGILAVSKDHRLSIDVPNAWIGSQPAFNDFQRYLFELQSGSNYSTSASGGAASLAIVDLSSVGDAAKEETDLSLNMHAALTLVSCELRHDTVGGEIVLASSCDARTGYVSFGSFLSPSFQQQANEQWNTIDFGTAANGGYSSTTVLPKQLLYPSIWGTFRHQANEGRLFIADPARSKYLSKTKRALNAAHYCALLEQEYGIEFAHCGSHSG